MAIISIITVTITAPVITCFELQFSLRVWADTVTRIPFIWLAVIVLMLLTYKPGLRVKPPAKVTASGQQLLWPRIRL